MNEIKILSAEKELSYKTPASFDEMTPAQFILTAQKILQPEDETYYSAITGISQKIWDKLHFYQRYSIKRLFDFTAESSPSITKQLLPCIEIDGQRFIGYQPTFSNTTWQEFIFADQYILSGKYREAAACLYRPQRSDYTGETDRRIPFTIYGTDTRMKYFNCLPEPDLFAFALNYKSLRKTHLEEKYPFVFPSATSRSQTNSKNNSQFSWIAIHRTLMGDHFYDETKFYQLNVHIILNRMNTTIQESRRK